MSPKPSSRPSLRDAIKEKQGESPGAGEQVASAPLASSPEDIRLNRKALASGPGLKQTAVFCRQLSTLTNVGISLQRSLQILGQRTHNPKMRVVVEDLSRNVDEGKTLSSALAAHPEAFPPFIANVVKIGEVGGILEASLTRLTDIMEKKLAIRRKIMAASAYPVIVLLVMVVVVSLVLTVAVPRFAVLLTQSGAELPAITDFTLSLSVLFVKFWWLLLAAFIGIVAVFCWYRKTPGGARSLESLAYSIPSFRNLPMSINMARTTRSIGSLMNAGIPLLESVKVTADASESQHIQEALMRVHNSLETGGKFETPLRDEEKYFPPVVADMIAVGEESGALDTMLLSIADNSDNEVETGLSALPSIIEPVLILIMGLAVLFVALSLFLPYFSL
ncbi:type II secretion system F family protein, partial [Candidatus Sumerlaeota bacterium]